MAYDIYGESRWKQDQRNEFVGKMLGIAILIIITILCIVGSSLLETDRLHVMDLTSPRATMEANGITQ